MNAATESILIDFGDSGHAPVRLPLGAHLSEYLTVQNSPVLFGCRTGICGTCLVRAQSIGDTPLDPPCEDEKQLLAIICQDNFGRLACQLTLNCDMRLEMF
jgi:ferredoxin